MDAPDPRDNSRTRWRGIAGGVAAAILVGLIGVLLLHGGAGRGSGPTGKGKSTPVPTPCSAPTNQPGTTPPTGPLSTCGPTETNPHPYTQPGNRPVLSPSDPQIVYEVTTSNVLERSTNGGKTFTQTAQPHTGLSELDYTGIAVSPLNANTVFFSAGGLKNGAGCPEPPAYGAIAMHGGVLASGFIPCSAQFVSTDGGQTWHALRLPTGGVLGGVQGYLAIPYVQDAQMYTIRSQGQRLYSAVAFSNQGGNLVDSPGARLVASADGGLTWKIVDDPIMRQSGGGEAVCDFAVSPTGTTIYATTSPGSCASETYPTIYLWRSDDAGASWTKVRTMPTLGESGLQVTNQGWLYTLTPQIVVQGHGASMSSTPADAVVSQDGGKTFTHAPSAGLPSGLGNPTSSVGLIGPFAVLSDGSVVYEVEKGYPNSTFTGALYTWKPGDSAWTKLSSDYKDVISSVAVSPAASGGDTLTLVNQNGDIATLTVSN